MADDIRLIIGVDDRDLIKAQKEQIKFERNILSIEAAFRKGDITAKRYTSELNKQAKQLSKLGGTYNKANSEVRSYAASVRKLTNDQLGMAQATNMAGKSTNRFGMYAQQVGYQVGDFFVQVQSGTSALVAFGQQGTQLAGLLPGVAGAVIGVSLAVGTMLLRTLLQAREAADSTSTGFVDFEASLKSARSATKELTQDIALLKGGFEDLNEAVLSNSLKKAQDALNALKIAAKLVGGPLGGKRTLNQEKAQSAIDLAQKELDVYLKQRAEKEKLVSLERARLAGISLFYEYQQRDLQIVKDRDAAVKKILDKQDKLNKGAALELTSLLSSNELLTKAILIGKDHVRVKALEREQTLKAYEDDLKRDGLGDDLIRGLVDQKQMAYLLADQLERAEAADQRRSKIKFSNLGMSDAMLALQYQEMGQSRANAPKEPPKAKKTSGAKESPQEKLAKYIEGKKQEQVLEKQLVGVLGEERQIQTELFNIKNQYAGVITPQQEKELENTLRLTQAERDRQAVVEEAASQQEQLANFIGNSMENAMMGIVDGTVSVKDAFKSMASEIIKELYRVLVVQQMVNAAKGFFGITAADGAVVSGGSEVKAYANGGVVSGPTTFPMAGGKTGLMGEAGPEAIMPLKRGSNGKLGVQMEGGSQGNVVINQSFNFQANGDDSVKKLIAQAAPKIADMAKASVIDSRRRGGSTKAAFG